MTKLNLSFRKTTGIFKPTESEIGQLETLARSINAIVQVMARYTNDCTYCGSHRGANEVTDNCACVFNALELLMEPLVNYMIDSAGKEAAPDSGA
jgi:hypothetical protein